MRRRTGARAAVDVRNLPPLPADAKLFGRPARCASNIHPDRQATVWGTFRLDPNRPQPGDKENVGYCAQCAQALELVGWFQPYDQPTPEEQP